MHLLVTANKNVVEVHGTLNIVSTLVTFTVTFGFCLTMRIN